MNSSLYQAYCKSQAPQLQEQHSAVKILLEIFQDTYLVRSQKGSGYLKFKWKENI